MKFHPTPTSPRLLYFMLISFMIIISCTKDNEMFESTVLAESSTTDEEQTTETTAEEKPDPITEENVLEDEPIDAIVEKIYETRTTIFPAIHDAHVQGDTGFNQTIVRIQEGFRTSYLMFDLSPIDSIGGTVNTTNLEFTIDSDDGNGTISVFKAISNDWSEEKLTAKTAPETEVLVGELATRYQVGQTQEVALDTAFVRNEVLTLILTHEQGNDLAFASKENPNGKGPALVVTYNAPQDAEAIVFDDEVELELQADIATDDTKTSTEDTPEENTVNEESTDTEEETTVEEATEENATEEETTKVDAAEEETAEETEEESTVEEATTEEATTEEATAEEATAEEATAEEATAEEATA
ncbi:DNRLRE domain-containing protein, partial [Pricia sp.]|uniref:DNRLRE domain-containing protein n=1 Tax=Pricia sp. TaxID=2268138 RepID=UPI00359434F0